MPTWCRHSRCQRPTCILARTHGPDQPPYTYNALGNTRELDARSPTSRSFGNELASTEMYQLYDGSELASLTATRITPTFCLIDQGPRLPQPGRERGLARQRLYSQKDEGDVDMQVLSARQISSDHLVRWGNIQSASQTALGSQGGSLLFSFVIIHLQDDDNNNNNEDNNKYTTEFIYINV